MNIYSACLIYNILIQIQTNISWASCSKNYDYESETDDFGREDCERGLAKGKDIQSLRSFLYFFSQLLNFFNMLFLLVRA